MPGRIAAVIVEGYLFQNDPDRIGQLVTEYKSYGCIFAGFGPEHLCPDGFIRSGGGPNAMEEIYRVLDHLMCNCGIEMREMLVVVADDQIATDVVEAQFGHVLVLQKPDAGTLILSAYLDKYGPESCQLSFLAEVPHVEELAHV